MGSSYSKGDKSTTRVTMEVIFHDYDEEGSGNISLSDFMNTDKTNERIKDIKIVFNNLSFMKGSQTSNIPPCNINDKYEFLSDVQPAECNRFLYHTVVVIETVTEGEGEQSKTLFWSLEKNNEVIVVQRSSNLQMLIRKLLGYDRAVALTYDRRIEDRIMEIRRADNIDMRDLLLFISQLENKVLYKWYDNNFNSQGFTRRIVKYIQNEDVRKNCSEIETLRRKEICLTGKLRYYIDSIYLDIFNKYDGSKIYHALQKIKEANTIDKLGSSLITDYQQEEVEEMNYSDLSSYDHDPLDLCIQMCKIGRH